MAENRLTLQNGYIYSYNGTDGRYSLVFGGINEAIVDDLIISGSSYLGDSSADRVEVTGSLKARNITGSIHTVDGNSPFLVAGSNVTTNFNAGTGQWTVSSTGGSSTPGGSANQVQLADGSGTSFSGSGGLWFNSTGSILYLSGNLVTAGNINANANTPRNIFADVVDITIGGASSVVNIAGDIKVTGNEIKSSANQVAITLSNTDVTIGGAITVSGNSIKSSTSTAMTLNGPSVTVGGDLQVSGNQIKSNTGAIALQLTGSSVTVGANLIVSGNTSLGNASNDSTTVLGQFTSRHITGSIYRVDGNNLFLNAGSNVTTTFDNATGQWTIASTAGGGGATVAGLVNHVQFNLNGTDLGATNGLWFNPPTNTLYVTGSVVAGSDIRYGAGVFSSDVDFVTTTRLVSGTARYVKFVGTTSSQYIELPTITSTNDRRVLTIFNVTSENSLAVNVRPADGQELSLGLGQPLFTNASPYSLGRAKFIEIVGRFRDSSKNETPQWEVVCAGTA